MGLCDGVQNKAGARARMHNSKAALLSEAVVELSRIVQAMGGKKETALGLAGMGDLYVTALGGRTSMFGQMIGSGVSPEQALAEMKDRHLTVEAYPATESAYKLAQILSKSSKLDVDNLPLLTQIYEVLFNGKDAEAAISDCFAALK